MPPTPTRWLSSLAAHRWRRQICNRKQVFPCPLLPLPRHPSSIHSPPTPLPYLPTPLTLLLTSHHRYNNRHHRRRRLLYQMSISRPTGTTKRSEKLLRWLWPWQHINKLHSRNSSHKLALGSIRNNLAREGNEECSSVRCR